MFAGPPNFEDVRKGDAPEPSYILALDSPCDAAQRRQDRELKLLVWARARHAPQEPLMPWICLRQQLNDVVAGAGSLSDHA